MSSIGQTVQVTLRLPKDMYERVTQAALMEQRQIEDLLSTLIAEGLEAHATYGNCWSTSLRTTVPA